jgi:small subunit ribosomal protein S3Ae
MSQQKIKKKKKAKLKKVTYKDKIWFQVVAPRMFKFKPIGEIVGLDNNVMDRVVEVLLYDFTNDFNDINLKLRFRINSINNAEKKASTIFVGHQYTNDYIRSLVGRGNTKITTIQNLTTKDGFVFRLTTVCVTIKRARSSQQIIIRKIMSDILKEFAKSLNHEKFVVGMIYGEFQNQIKRVAKTLYPLSSSTTIKSKLIAYPEGIEDTEVSDKQFEIVEVDVKRSRKSEIKRSERINVKKIAQAKVSTEKEKGIPINEEEVPADTDINDQEEAEK